METMPNQNRPTGQTLSIIVPAYNEGATIAGICDKIAQVSLIRGVGKEIVIVNDCSSDNTDDVIAEYKKSNPHTNIAYVKHGINRGKGAALKTGIAQATGDFIIVQDADLEYDPSEYNLLLGPILDGFADAVYGSRFIGGNPHRILFFGTR